MNSGDDANAYVLKLKKVFPEVPMVFTTDSQQIKNWLPLVDAVFIHQKTSGWVSGSGFSVHHQMLMVVPETPNPPDTNLMIKNMRECSIDMSNVYLLSDAGDVERLQQRFASATIQEK